MNWKRKSEEVKKAAFELGEILKTNKKKYSLLAISAMVIPAGMIICLIILLREVEKDRKKRKRAKKEDG